jgi:hypothetical protein
VLERTCWNLKLRNRAFSYTVAAGEFIKHGALRAPPDGLFLLRQREGRWTAHVLSLGLGAAPAFGGAGADKVTLHVRQSAEYRQHQAPGASAGVRPRLGERTELRFGVDNSLDDGEQVERAARQSVNPCHRHHVAGAELAEHPVEFAQVGPRARYLLAVNVAAAASRRAQLLELAVESLPVGADARISG